ncbi:MAG: hypothetical protein R3C44_24490 [Chloroflexota bacterium]
MSPAGMKPEEFAAKWSRIQQKERSTAQTHFNDICRLIGHPTPLEMDPDFGRNFSFEIQAEKPEGEKWATPTSSTATISSGNTRDRTKT